MDAIDPEKSKFINYDDLNRLVQVDEGIPPRAGGTPLPVEDYAYDEEGNRTASHLSSLYTSNDHNQLLEDDAFTYAYDAKGNRVSKTSKADGAVETYMYDSQNRLVGYASDTTVASYIYDALERRVAKTVDGAQMAYIYDTSIKDPLAHDDIVMTFDTDGPAVLTRRWTHSAAVDEPIGFEDYTSGSGAGSGAERLMFADRQGAILWVTEPVGGSVVAAYEYEGYGVITQTEGALTQPYGFTGREYDVESGLYYYRTRAMDPSNGLFLQQDPLEFKAGSFNVFGYVQQNPYRFSDPTGMISTTEFRKASADYAATGISVFTPDMEATIALSGSIARALQFSVTGTNIDAIPAINKPNCSSKILSMLQAMKPTSLPRCKGTDKDYKNLLKMSKISIAILARRGITEACFSGGDDGNHGTGPTGALAQLYTQLANCKRLIHLGTQ